MHFNSGRSGGRDRGSEASAILGFRCRPHHRTIGPDLRGVVIQRPYTGFCLVHFNDRRSRDRHGWCDPGVILKWILSPTDSVTYERASVIVEGTDSTGG